MAGRGIHNELERFKLIDVDRAVITNSSEDNFLIVPEPQGMDAVKLSVERDPNDRGGTNFEFGNADTPLHFDYHGEGRHAYIFINDILEVKGTDANIGFAYEVFENGDFQEKYYGLIIPSTDDQKDYIDGFSVERVDYDNKLRTRGDVTIPYDTNVDLDGNTIDDYQLIDLPLHSQEIVFDAVKNVSAPLYYDDLSVVPTQNLDTNLLWHVPAFNDITISQENFSDYGDVFGVFEDSFADDQEKFADKNPLVINSQHVYKCTALAESLDVSINHEFEMHISTSTVNSLGQVVDSDEITFHSFYLWVVNDGVFKQVEHTFFETDITNTSDFNTTVTNVYTGTIELVEGDELYYGGLCPVIRTSPTDIAVRYDFRRFDSVFGFFSISVSSQEEASTCKGAMIYETLNRLLQKAIGTSGVGELTINYSALVGSFTNGQTVVGATSNATGKIFSQSTGVLRLIDVTGSFVSGETINQDATSANIDSFIIGAIENGSIPAGKILSSSLLEKTEQGAVSDGCGALNFVTNGFAIRNFINDEYNPDRFYRKDDKVVYESVDYVYINNTITKGNLPTDGTYWEEQEGLKINSSINKLVKFVKHRYGAGIAIVKQEGSGYGVDTDRKVTKVLIEPQSYFFADVEIHEFQSIESLVRRVNKEVVYNTINLGYSVYGEANEDETLTGFNTTREYLTPIQKDSQDLNLISDVGLDGDEIERLRRLTLSEQPKRSDSKDDDTFIIKCHRYNSSNKIESIEFDGAVPDTRMIVDRDEGIFTLYGLSLGDQIGVGGLFTPEDSLGLFNFGTDLVIDSIDFNKSDNLALITTSTPITGTGVVTVPYYKIYFNTDVFLPARAQGFSNISGVVNDKSTYNLDHTPTNILVNNFNWFGSGLRAKQGSETIKFSSGKNNIFVSKQYDGSSCFPNTDITVENSDFTLTVLRNWNPAFWTEYLYEVKAQRVSWADFEKIRLALIGESELGLNYGYIPFVNNLGESKRGDIFSMSYDKAKLTLDLVLWERHTI